MESLGVPGDMASGLRPRSGGGGGAGRGEGGFGAFLREVLGGGGGESDGLAQLLGLGDLAGGRRGGRQRRQGNDGNDDSDDPSVAWMPGKILKAQAERQVCNARAWSASPTSASVVGFSL